jgi:zinc protease
MSTATHRGLAPVRQTLANGTVILAQETATHPALFVSVGVHAGSALDPPDAVGVAHFVSRVIDRGTETRTADVMSDELDGRGVALHVGVSRHLLTLSCMCLAEDLEPILDLIADVLRRPTFPAQEVEIRRGEIVTAIRQDEDSPASMALEALFGLLYPGGHPYGRPAKGEVPVVERMCRDQLVAFHGTHVGPTGMIVVLVGDVETGRAVDAASSAFADWPATSPGVFRPPAAPRVQSRRRVVIPMRGKAQVDVAYGFATVTRHDPDYYALTLMNNVLGQYGLGGRLGDSIRERQGMAYYAFSTFDGNVAEGPLVIRAGVAPEHVDRTIDSIDEEVRRILDGGVTPSELADAKRYLVGSLPRVLETNAGIAGFLQSVEFFDLGPSFDRRLPPLLESVTLDEVHAATRRVLDPDRAAVAIAGPYPEEPDPDRSPDGTCTH